MAEPDATTTFPLGRAPRPTTGPELGERVLATIAAETGGRSGGRVSATVDGADIPSLEIDLTGLVVSDARRSSQRTAVHGRERGTVGRLRVEAHPLTVESIPVDLRADAEKVPFSWVEGTDGSLAAELVEPSPEAPLVGTGRVAAPRTAVVAAVERRAAELVAGQGLKLTKLEVDLTSQGPRAVAVAVRAQLRKGILSATATGGARATIDDNLVLTLSDITATSGNPFVAALLAAAKGRLAALEGRRIDLGTQVPAGVHIVDVQLEVGDQLVLTARAG
ncbi:hypothetical protein [Cellulomonas edaphi]|uniref:DUF2993 domain-containing protein n=1 Tax=Cellulomonas edaphi TaxID=3053468 RepID=A0ABT7S2M1_9CELL|nr:hypothetical protein [Cellulomons edaphi]MDM7829861.1 hypothetical protein [Cellulomons edaphi]